MHGVFDQDEIDARRERHDTELTLGSGTLLTIFFALVLLCGLCFGMGYAVGHRNYGPAKITAPQSAPDQEPLQASGSIPKPSAIVQTPVAQPGQATADGSGTASGGGPAATANPGSSQVQAALPAAGAVTPVNPAQSVRPALPQTPAQVWMVQIAAVSNPEDANVLVSALKNRNYPVTEHRDPADNYIQVRIGPFATHAIAEQWRMKLLNDGYNAIIQP